MRRHVLGTLAFVVPTFPLGYIWHLVVFESYYASLNVYRDEILIPFGIVSMLIQGVIWSFLYSRLFASETVTRGTIKFMTLVTPLALSYLVFVIGAKHQMTSVSGFAIIETAFTVLHYSIFSPLLALIHAKRTVGT